MAYEGLSNQQLIQEIHARTNTLENMTQAIMRRVEELKRRGLSAAEPVAPPTLPKPQPAPSPISHPWVKLVDIPEILPDFDVSSLVQKGGPPVPAHPSDQASFRLHQGVVEVSLVDPTFHVEKGSHPHTWINRAQVPVSGDYREIRTTGEPVGEGRKINRTIYGYASLMVQDMDGRWHLSIPTGGGIIYYKLEGPEHPFWAKNPQLIRSALPRGIRMLGGNKHYPRDQWPASRDFEINAPCAYNPLDGPLGNPTEVKSRTSRLRDLLPFCQPGRHIGMHISFPTLHDGIHADSPDHISHVAYRPSEPWHREERMRQIEHMRHVIPNVSYHINHTLPDFPIKDLAISSDLDQALNISAEPGSTGHGYFLDGWVDEFRNKMFDVTFARNLNHSNGDYGDGVQLLSRDDSRWPRVKSVPYDPSSLPLNLLGLGR